MPIAFLDVKVPLSDQPASRTHTSSSKATPFTAKCVDKGRNNVALVVCSATALYDFTSRSGDELNVRTGERLQLISRDAEWAQCRNASGGSGLVPLSYVKEDGGIKRIELFIDLKYRHCSIERVSNTGNSDDDSCVRLQQRRSERFGVQRKCCSHMLK